MSRPIETFAFDSSNHLTGWRLHAVIACLFFGSFTIALDMNIINVALPNISSDFKTIQDFAWYGSAYLLTITAFQPVYGAWYKYFRTDVVYRTSIAVFEVGSILCAAAVNSNMFIIGRAVAGFGAAGVLQGALSIISQIVTLEQRPVYMGVVISVFAISTTVGPVLGGAFTQEATWRWCFWINLPIGAIVLAGLTVFLKLPGRANRDRSLAFGAKLKSMDPLGCLLFVGTIVCLLLALQWGGQTKAWNSADVIGCFIGAALIGALFLVWQWKAGDEALIPLRVLQRRSIWAGAMVLFFIGAQTFVNVFVLPFWFQGVRGLRPIMAGVDFIPFLLPQLISLIIVGAIVQKFGHYVPYMVLGPLIAIGGQAMLTQLHPDSSTVYWASSLVVAGIGTGMAMQLPYIAVAVVLSDDDIPVGNAIAVFFYQLGGAVFISVSQTVTITALLDLVPERLPQLPPQSVIKAGAANLQAFASDPQTLAVLRDIWNAAVTRAMYLGVAVLAGAIPFSLAMEWLNSVKVAQARKERAERIDYASSTQEVSDVVVDLEGKTSSDKPPLV